MVLQQAVRVSVEVGVNDVVVGVFWVAGVRLLLVPWAVAATEVGQQPLLGRPPLLVRGFREAPAEYGGNHLSISENSRHIYTLKVRNRSRSVFDIVKVWGMLAIFTKWVAAGHVARLPLAVEQRHGT